ncbi:MAG: AAC(3) family N-acetyltransferase [Flavobacteriales bacterium]
MDQPAAAAVSVHNPLRDRPARIGLKPGDNVLLSADITRIVWMHRRSGAAQVPTLLLDAFLDHLGPTGTLVLPTFNHDLRDGEPYDPQRTLPITGALSAAAIQHPAFVRTAHPLHSFAVAGREQHRFKALDDASSFSASSPFALFRSCGFKVIGIDMDLDYAFSYFHHVEELERVPYRRWKDYTIQFARNGAVTRRTFRLHAKRWGYANRLRDLVPLLKDAGALETITIDDSRVILVDVARSHDVIVQDIRHNAARSIVHFTWRNWLRDLVNTMRPQPPSRSATQLREADARPH